jgi:ABC-type transport system involved in multi-copper enzyme maturation permease subunit
MTRLTLRLARPNILASIALLAAVALYAVLTRRAMTAYLDDSGLRACLASGGDCQALARDFSDKFNVVIGSKLWITLVPLLTGMFWGGPLIAREVEQGTHRLAWTQSVSRGRWLATKLGIFLLGATVVAAALTRLMTWWFAPVEQIQDDFGRLKPEVFDFRGIVPIAYTLFAFALGAAAGAIFKRTVVAMAVTLVAYLPIKIGVQVLRGHYLAPLNVTYAFGTNSPRRNSGDWLLGSEVIDRSGRILGSVGVSDPCNSLAGRAAAEACAVQNGYRFVDTYQPLSRFWPFQFIESGIFVGLSIAVLAVAVWWILRRTA